MHSIRLRGSTGSIVLLCWGAVGFAQSGTLKFSASLKRDSLKSVVSVCVSPDGKFAYAAAYNAASVTAFRRNPKTGGLTHLQTIQDRDLFGGVTAFRLSRDGRMGVAASFRSRTVSLFSRDPKTGKLVLTDVEMAGKRGAKDLDFVIEAAFSPDGRFVYAVAASSEALTVFRVDKGCLLEFLASDKGRNSCLKGARGIAISPDGKAIYVTAHRAGTLTVFARDPESGKTTLKQVLTDGVGGIDGLAGAMSVTCSADGKFVYTSAGRFGGDDAVCAFKRTRDGTLTQLQVVANANGFRGGNELLLSPKGEHLYALGTKSGSIAVFRRDAKTGKLSPLQTLSGTGGGELRGVSGLAVSPDGRFLYAAAELGNAVSVFERATSAKPR